MSAALNLYRRAIFAPRFDMRRAGAAAPLPIRPAPAVLYVTPPFNYRVSPLEPRRLRHRHVTTTERRVADALAVALERRQTLRGRVEQDNTATPGTLMGARQ